MTSLTALCTIAAVGILLIILSYIAIQGLGALNLNFLLNDPRPVGEGGGIRNAILGTLMLLLISSAIGLPFGIMVGIYLSEFGSGRFGSLVRFLVDTLTGIPSIVTGVFVYTIVVVPSKHFSGFAGGIALALIMIPNGRPIADETSSNISVPRIALRMPPPSPTGRGSFKRKFRLSAPRP